MQSALGAKATLEIAKGMLAAYAGISVPEAGRHLSDHAISRRVSLADTVNALVNRRMELESVMSGPLTG
ncbi:ANTAR domain-containing protein [Streptomyces sp. NPDC014006]|uniref:ANTAR domain-containing protein n=1 Tax=Streptomyces sp. NPDC014006 TaxID=3364870 RepID=UPI0036FAD81D